MDTKQQNVETRERARVTRTEVESAAFYFTSTSPVRPAAVSRRAVALGVFSLPADTSSHGDPPVKVACCRRRSVATGHHGSRPHPGGSH